MKYSIAFSEEALQDLVLLKKSGDKAALKKCNTLIEELSKHPETGTGKPEQLKNNFTGYWSRQISQKHRLIYRIDNDIVTVIVVQCYGHYNDK